MIVRSLYGVKYFGADYWIHVHAAIDEIGFVYFKYDTDVWMRPGMKDDSTEYCQYVLLYTDDILAVME